MVLLGVLSALLIAGLLVGAMWVWWLAGCTFPRPRRASRNARGAQAAIQRHPAGRERWPEPDGLRARGQPGGTTTRSSSARWSGSSGARTPAGWPEARRRRAGQLRPA